MLTQLPIFEKYLLWGRYAVCGWDTKEHCLKIIPQGTIEEAAVGEEWCTHKPDKLFWTLWQTRQSSHTIERHEYKSGPWAAPWKMNGWWLNLVRGEKGVQWCWSNPWALRNKTYGRDGGHLGRKCMKLCETDLWEI